MFELLFSFFRISLYANVLTMVSYLSMKFKRHTIYIEGIVRRQGNGAHVMCPTEWIGKNVHVIPDEELSEAALKEYVKGKHFRIK